MRNFIFGVILAFGTLQQAVAVEVSPPNWWAGMSSPELELMLHSEGVAKKSASIEYPGVEIHRQIRTDNPNYLFLQISLAEDVKPGTFSIDLSDESGVHSIMYELKSRRKNSASRKGFSSQDVIYLITPDRFVNGDPSNDNVKGYADKMDRSYKGGRHGGDIQGIIDSLDYIADMGFTQIWTMPLLDNAMERYSYHGYSTTDYFKIDPRFGSNELYAELSRKGREKGVGIIKDVVLNHIGSNHAWMSDMPSRDWVNHGTRFVQTTHRREALHDPHAVQDDISGFADGWFVPTMPDLNQRNPLVANYLIQYAIWWIEYADLAGLRVDTYSYSDKAFLSLWTQRLVGEYPNINIVGEEWTTNPAITAYWQKGSIRYDDYQSELPSVMDFPFQVGLANAIKNEETWATGLRQLYEVFATDFLYGDPYNLVIFGDNHDMSRVMTQFNDDIDQFKMALGIIATARGIPQIFYGTEIGMSHPGTDDHGLLRADFPGGWQDDKVNAFTRKGLTERQSEIQEFVKSILNFRQNSAAITQGDFTHYAPNNGVYTYFRHTDNELVMVVLNKNETNVNLELKRFNQFIASGDIAINVVSNECNTLADTLELNAKSTHIFSIQKNN